MIGDIEELTKFGPVYLTGEELAFRLKQVTNTYYISLAKAVLEHRGKEFWSYHRTKAQQLGLPIDYIKLARYVFCKNFRLILNPIGTMESIYQRGFK
jgi:hypothetical protein